MATLESFEWGHIRYFGLVDLSFSGRKIRMRYSGFANIDGRAVAVLTTTGETGLSLQQIKETIDSQPPSEKIYLDSCIE